MSYSLTAQVTIGFDEEPAKAALLQIKDKKVTDPATSNVTAEHGGLLLPRILIQDIQSLAPLYEGYNTLSSSDKEKESLLHTGLMVYHVGSTALKEGVYIWHNNKWNPSSSGGAVSSGSFFYMPSFPIMTGDLGTQGQVNLHEEYLNQFVSPVVVSEEAPAEIPHIPGAEDLYYYVTYYDTNVFEEVTISKAGILTYKNKGIPVTASYMNVVFVVK